MSDIKFEIGTVYKNRMERTNGSAVAGWKCVDRKISIRKNARCNATSKIVTVRFIRVDVAGNEFGKAYSMRVAAWMTVEEVRWGGKFHPSLKLQADIAVLCAA